MSCEENLIILVKDNEFLYNTKLKAYKNVIKRASTWEKISKQLNRPADECKQRWKSLRDRFVREKKKLEIPSGSGASVNEKWDFYEAMEFLIPSLTTRRQIGNYGGETEGHTFINPFQEDIPLEQETSGATLECEVPDASTPRKGCKRKSDEALSDFLGGLKKTLCDHLQMRTSNLCSAWHNK